MTNLTRRRLFGLTAAVMASTAVPALMWAQGPLNQDRIVAALIAMSDEYHENYSWRDRYTADETESHKKLGGWPEYGSA